MKGQPGQTAEATKVIFVLCFKSRHADYFPDDAFLCLFLGVNSVQSREQLSLTNPATGHNS